MSVKVIIGTQWGDEGKGKIVDLLAQKADLVIRFNGGNNAGHTVVNEYGKLALHLIPSGIFNPRTLCVIASGVVVHPPTLLKEMEELASKGVNLTGLRISDRSHLVMPWHLLEDASREALRGKNKLGTTSRGIGPTYQDKVARDGVRVGDLLWPEIFRQKVTTLFKQKLNLGQESSQKIPGPREIIQEYLEQAQKIAPLICQTEPLIWELYKKGKEILLEGAQGTFLDIDFGTYPYVTSSSTTSGGACVGSGLAPTKIDEVIGVVKAYTTRVGQGPFPTELDGAVNDILRERGKEYGATTGRPRRCGWFDAVLVRFSAELNGLKSLAITKLDVLDDLPTIKICTAYELAGKRLEYPPSGISELEKCVPVYEELPGWQRPLRLCRRFEELPSQTKEYLKRIEELSQVKINLISVGPAREETIENLELRMKNYEL